MLRFSIIMPVKNAARTVKQAVDSFCAQEWPEKELLVVDGGSVDGTLAILAEYAGNPQICVIREADNSATQGLVRGAALSTGDLIGLLMADDALAPGALTAWAQSLEQADVASGGVIVRDELAAPPREILRESASIGLTLESILGVPYPAAFAFRRSAWDAMGGFNLSYRYAADRDLLMRCRLAALRHQRTEETVYMYRRHDGSDTLVDNAPVIMAFLADHLRMAQSWLATPGLAAQDRETICAWRRVQIVALAAHYARAGASMRALKMVAAETIRDTRVGVEAMQLAGALVMSRFRRSAVR